MGAADGPGTDKAQLAEMMHLARTARDVQEIQNLMSRRAMYHSVGQNEKELALWAKNAEIRWAQNQGCWVGRDAIENYYVTVNYAMQKAQLKRVSELNPSVENDFAKNRFIGNSIYHLLTTPIIEVARDGKTAKGFWYTPGAILSSEDGRTARGINMWERYGADFIGEDGEWRFLHIQVNTDFAAPFGEPLPTQTFGAAAMGSEGGKDRKPPPGPSPGAEGIKVPGPTIAKRLYEEYGPTRVPTITPRLPEPYEALADTFEYADCGTNPKEAPASATAPAAAPPGDASANPDPSPFVAAIDADGDGRMSYAEWSAKSAPDSAFDVLDKDKDGFVTKADMDNEPAPPGIDLNGDGKLTLEEFLAFDKAMSAKRGEAPPQPQ